MKWGPKIRNLAALILLCLMATNCGKQRERLAAAFVIDVTASVDSDAINEAFSSLGPLLEGKKFKRGDSVCIIPITGDTLTESQGKILRFHLNEKRELYDSDLQKLARDINTGLQRMRSKTSENPYMRSDVLGAVDLAAEELATEKGNVRRVIIILSDFIQDDSKANFNTSSDLTSERAAIEFAKKLAAPRGLPLRDVTAHLGMLRSKDLKKMSDARRNALLAFWKEYINQNGAKGVTFSMDGPGKIPKVLETLAD